MTEKRIMIAGGGTGGHIFPAIAIANALQAQDATCRFLFVGSKGKMEMTKIPVAGFHIKGISMVGWNRSHLLKNIGLPLALLKSFQEVKSIFISYKPHIVIGVGGYSSFPVLRYAQWKKIPTCIHESNSLPGKVNQWIGKRAYKIFVATEGMEQYFPKEKLYLTGNPIRSHIITHRITKESALSFFNLQPIATTILIIGGSLGARTLNDAIANHLDLFQQKNIQLIWQTGEMTFSVYQPKATSYKNISIHAFIDDMAMAYMAADMVVSRAGAMAIAELSYMGKPTIFVPFPFAAEDHQTANATYLVNKKAAWMVRDHMAKTDMVNRMIDLANQPIVRANMSEQFKKLAIDNAAERIAKEILSSDILLHAS